MTSLRKPVLPRKIADYSANKGQRRVSRKNACSRGIFLCVFFYFTLVGAVQPCFDGGESHFGFCSRAAEYKNMQMPACAEEREFGGRINGAHTTLLVGTRTKCPRSGISNSWVSSGARGSRTGSSGARGSRTGSLGVGATAAIATAGTRARAARKRSIVCNKKAAAEEQLGANGIGLSWRKPFQG